MSIIKTITDKHEFADWIKSSDSYKNNFTVDGAVALQEYLNKTSNELGENVEFDPIAWCCEWSEYESFSDIWEEKGNNTNFIEGEELAIDDNIEQWLENNTTIIKLDTGNILVKEF